MKSTAAMESRGVMITLGELNIRYALSNQADGKSPKTIRWYGEMLVSFTKYLEAKHNRCDLSGPYF